MRLKVEREYELHHPIYGVLIHSIGRAHRYLKVGQRAEMWQRNATIPISQLTR